MEQKDIRYLAELMKEMGLTVLEYSEGVSSIRMESVGKPVAVAPVVVSEVPAQAVPAVETGKDFFMVTAPMIGVFYAAPAPDMNPFVSVGDTVKEGDVLCVIEAMKIMNEIIAEVSGTIEEVYVGNGQIVDYGHPLFRISQS